MKIFFTRHDGGLTYFRDGKQFTVSSSVQNFDKIVEALETENYDHLEVLLNPAKSITNAANFTMGKIFVEDGEIFFNDTRNRKKVKLHGSLVERILRDLGKPNYERFATALIKLLENISLNKSKDISEELYEWLSSGKAPITSDGCILAYKKVRQDYKDQYSGSFDNSPGKIVWIKQDEVDTNRNNHCSRGLHFCSLGYLSSYGCGTNSRVMVVKINPRHIFAIPTDYKFQKGRCSEYYVVGEYQSDNKELVEAFKDSFVDEDNLQEAAPDVQFVDKTMRPSLKVLAERHGYSAHGKVRVKYANDGTYMIVKIDNKDGKLMSIETKSIRKMLKELIDELEA